MFEHIFQVCWHMIRDRIESGKPIQPLDIHPHWPLKRPPGAELPYPEEVIFDPVSWCARRNVEAERRAQARVRPISLSCYRAPPAAACHSR